jgi:hypothetical protein
MLSLPSSEEISLSSESTGLLLTFAPSFLVVEIIIIDILSCIKYSNIHIFGQKLPLLPLQRAFARFQTLRFE